jgi:hypothetical protein
MVPTIKEGIGQGKSDDLWDHYHVTRTTDLYMHGEWRNFPPSRALGALPPVHL